MKKQKSSRGQTLLEILLAFGVSILVLSAIIVVVNASLSNAQYTKNQSLANSYAAEAMSVVKQIRDSNWSNFISYVTGTTYCLDQNKATLRESDPPPLVCGQNVEIFSREVRFEHASDSCLADPACMGPSCLKGSKVAVKVLWSDSKCPSGNIFCHQEELITCLSNIYQKQSP
ncbi:MAG: type II secretion system protein [Candidatus Levybacteria bacterium]|nr:type II secretion system protein [Candidatus Levybacteria bacterium]